MAKRVAVAASGSPKVGKKRKKLTTAELFLGPPGDEADLLYLTGFMAPDPFALLRFRGRLHLIVHTMEEERARRTSRAHTVWSPATLGVPAGGRASVQELIVRAARSQGVGEVLVSRQFPLAAAETLRAAGIRVRVRPGAACARDVKTEREIRLIARSQRAAAAAMRRARRILAESRPAAGRRLVWNGAPLTSEVLRGEIEMELLRRDCRCEGTIAAGGAQGADPHERGRGALRAGEFIVLDIFPRDRRSGYFGDMTRTYVKGAATRDQRRRYGAVRRAHRAAMKRIRAGASCAAVHAAAIESLERDGYPLRRVRGRMEGMIHGTGHGVGLEIHESPRLSAGGRDRLRAGHVVSVEPGVYSGAAGGVRIEDLVVVRRDGCRKLATAPEGLVIP